MQLSPPPARKDLRHRDTSRPSPPSLLPLLPRRVWRAALRQTQGERGDCCAAAPQNRAPLAKSSSSRTWARTWRSEEHTSELQSLMRISYAVFCLKKKKRNNSEQYIQQIKNEVVK